MLSVYTIMTSGSLALSDRQLKMCILLLLDYDESIIAAMLGSKPQTPMKNYSTSQTLHL